MTATTVTNRPGNGGTDSSLRSHDAANCAEQNALAGNDSLAATPVRCFGTGSAFRIVPGRAGDHHAVHRLLVSTTHQPSAVEYQAQLDEPGYEPLDRLLVKRDEQIVGHVRVSHREMHFGLRIIPVSLLYDLAVLPEYRQEGCAAELLAEAEAVCADGGAQMVLTRTRSPEFFEARGWVAGGRPSCRNAGAREILARLQEEVIAPTGPLAPDVLPLNIRIWRHVERAALLRLYNEQARSAYGALVRSDDYWRWLISRRAYDRIYVAIEGPDRLDLEDTRSPIVGYAVMREGRILELITAADRPHVGAQLLGRACGDAIEHDIHHGRLDAPEGDRLYEILKSGGERRAGTDSGTGNGEMIMVKMFDPVGFLQEQFEGMHQNAVAAGWTLPTELGLLVAGERMLLSIRPRSIKLQPGKLGRSYIACGPGELTQMLIGQLDLPAAIEQGRVQASTRVAVESAQVVFPRMAFWLPPFEDSPA